MNLLQAVNNTTVTDNGCLTHASSLSPCLDLFFAIGAARGRDLSSVFSAAYAVNPDIALRTLLWARDIRGGAGERQQFKNIVSMLIAQNAPEKQMQGIIIRTPTLGRWDDLQVFWGTPYENLAAYTWVTAIKEGNGLAAKWAPRKDKKGAKPLRKALGLNEHEWRKRVVAASDTVEQKMCAKQWDDIDFSKLPSVASSRYMTAFHRNAAVRYEAYKAALVKNDGSAKVNAGAVYPYDIIKGMAFSGQDEVANAQWAALPDYIKDGENFLPIVDVSPSMNAAISPNLKCVDVAISLGLYLAERNKGILKDVMMTFSESPQLFQVKGTLRERYNATNQIPWGMTTNLEAVFDVLLNAAKVNNLPEVELPRKLLIISDMQFNSCIQGTSAMDMIKLRYEQAGYTMPQLVFWQVNAKDSRSPATVHSSGVALVSGFSPSLMTSLLGGELDPTNIMLDTVMVDRYKIIGLF